MKILFIDTTHTLLPNMLNEAGWEVVDGSNITKDNLIKQLNNFEGIIIRSRFVLDKEFLSHASRLKFIGRPGAGLENIDISFCKQNKIEVFRSPEGNRDAVAEHAIGMLLMLFNKLNSANKEVKSGIWNRIANRGEEIMGKTIGILGYGYMGEAFARRLSGFGCQVIAYDKYIKGFSSNFVEEVSLQDFFARTDVLSIHTPLTEETRGLINDKFINQFNKRIYLINTARGQSVVLDDLAKNIKSGKVKGACLDVLEIEKTTFEEVFEESRPDSLNYLMEQGNVLFSPHVAGWSNQSNEKMAFFLGEKILRHFSCY